MMEANSGNRSGQSIQNGEAGFTAFFRLAALPCPCLPYGRYAGGIRARVGSIYSMRFGTELSVRLSLFGLCFK